MFRMERSHSILAALFLSFALTSLPPDTFATDVDGPDDCPRQIEDMGDAPEGIFAYPISAPGVIAAFPTCLTPGPVGTQTLPVGCPAISTAPGPAGYVIHRNVGFQNFWLGCFAIPGGFYGIDGDADGKVNLPATGFSACNPPLLTDCADPAEGGIDQDECYADGSDATLNTKVIFGTCTNNTFNYDVYLCSPQGSVWQAHLNILVDWNQDGDWNDAFVCQGASGPVCVYEWAVKNAPITLLPGCNNLVTPGIAGGPFTKKNVWMRLSVSTDPMTDDFPWAGTVNWAPQVNHVRGGETEDYLVDVTPPTPTVPQTWGLIKSIYR